MIFAGKAHPDDNPAKEYMRRLIHIIRRDDLRQRVIFLEDYDMNLARYLVQGVDVWLNTPRVGQEASGTSGMKAALNGVPSLSILDGWWIEGHIEGLTGWSFGEIADDMESADNRMKDAGALYDKLESVVIPLFYNNREQFTNIMLHAIALNGSFFNTQRMMQQYVMKAYF